MRFFLFIILTSIVACNETASERVAKELKNHLQPRDSIINKIKIGETFVLQSSERDGIDRERFREFTYWKDIDNTFFENNDNKGFSNPDEAGGMITSLQIYKALKKGYTEVKFYKAKYHHQQEIEDSVKTNTDTVLYNTYKFNIE